MPAPADPARATRRRRGRLAPVAALLIVTVAIGVLAAMVLRQDGAAPAAQPDTPADTVVPTAGSTAPSVPPLPFPVGVYRGTNPSEVTAYEEWLGRPVDYVLEFWGRGEDWSQIANPSWVADQWRDTGREVIYSLALLPSDSYSLEDGAAGEYDEYWRSFARVMVERGESDAILRMGWEFNGPFFPWGAPGKEQAFVDYWRRVVDVLRSVDGTDFRFEWAPLAGFTATDLEAAYPGDEYVDLVGLDVYDISNVQTTPEERWVDVRDRRYGLTWQRDFAAAHDKPTSYGEWGAARRLNDGLGGGDNPLFITNMFAWMKANPPAYAVYFEYVSNVSDNRLMTGEKPRSAETFRRLFGPAG